MTDQRVTRRSFLQATLAGAWLNACQKTEGKAEHKTPSSAADKNKKPKRIQKSQRKIVVLGFDGVDPRLVERWIQAGQLPNLATLARSAGLRPLASTCPPNSPVAWSTFATGLPPTEHGIFGFIKRNPTTYVPGTAPYTVHPPRFGPNGAQAPRAVSHRRREAWWERLDRAGVRVGLLSVPYAYPPPELHNGRVLAGLGAPDLRFTNSSFTLYTSEPGDDDRVAGGRIVRLTPNGSRVDTKLDGPRGPDKAYLSARLQLTLDRKAGRLAIALGGKRQELVAGERSAWFPVRFATEGLVLLGRVRFHLLSLDKELKLYASPIQLDPGRPALPLGAPADWVERAVSEHALPTLGWVHDTSAVCADVLPKPVFLGALLDTMEARAALLDQELAADWAQVTCAVFTGTDRGAHIFYRELAESDGGPLLRIYQAMDGIIGQVRKRISADTRLVVLSDHGFHAFERQLHVNTWLETQGWLKRTTKGGPVRFLRGIDWSQTRAYGLGNGQLYINLKGRERAGIVSPGEQRRALLDQVTKRLLQLRDPETGQKPVRAVYPVADQAAAELGERAPDLQIAFAPGWRSSWETSLGGAPTEAAIVPNNKAWCGDHAASDVAITPGVVLSDRPQVGSDADLKDLAPSIEHLCGLEPTGPGRPLWN